MNQLTNHTMQRVIKALDEAYFTAGRFDLSFPYSGDTYLDARFVDNHDFFFTITKATDQYDRPSFAVEYTPGAVTSIQE